MANFQTRDPLSPAFWDERFEKQFTPWDQGGVPARLRRFVAGSPAPLRCLIPGCGSAYELVFMLDHGWDATAIDFSPAAVAAARAVVGARAGQVVQADFFAWQPAAPLDLIYERAFLCAMPRAMWPQVAAAGRNCWRRAPCWPVTFSLMTMPRDRRSAFLLSNCRPCWRRISTAWPMRPWTIPSPSLPARNAG